MEMIDIAYLIGGLCLYGVAGVVIVSLGVCLDEYYQEGTFTVEQFNAVMEDVFEIVDFADFQATLAAIIIWPMVLLFIIPRDFVAYKAGKYNV